VSVFRHFDRFAAINPVVKAPSFVTDDGVVLMDSSLMLEHIAHLAPRPPMPPDRASHEVALRQIGLALAACEKSVSILYERTQRPTEKQHQPWLDRVRGQLLTAYGLLEKEVSPDWFTGEELMQQQITVAVAWRFSQHRVGDVVPADDFPQAGDIIAAGRAACRLSGIRFRLGHRSAGLGWKVVGGNKEPRTHHAGWPRRLHHHPSVFFYACRKETRPMPTRPLLPT
jgi:glutathione S-transferase